MLMGKYEVRVLYNRAAILLRGKGDSYIVVGDLHIGMERKLRDKSDRGSLCAKHIRCNANISVQI